MALARRVPTTLGALLMEALAPAPPTFRLTPQPYQYETVAALLAALSCGTADPSRRAHKPRCAWVRPVTPLWCAAPARETPAQALIMAPFYTRRSVARPACPCAISDAGSGAPRSASSRARCAQTRSTAHAVAGASALAWRCAMAS